jgi:hypothetical protein
MQGREVLVVGRRGAVASQSMVYWGVLVCWRLWSGWWCWVARQASVCVLWLDRPARVQWGEGGGKRGVRSTLEWPVGVFIGGLLPVFMYGWEQVWRCSGAVGCWPCVAVWIGATVGVERGFGSMLWARLVCLE